MRAGIRRAAFRGRRKVQHDVGQSDYAPQAGGTVEVGKDRAGALIAPESALLRIAHQGEDPIMAEQTGQRTASHITTADDQ